MKLAVIGSRGVLDYDIRRFIPINTVIIISGGAKGIDTIAEEYASENGIHTVIIKPDYAKYGRNATLVRNRQIVDMADVVLAFWDGESHGTKFTIDYARQQGKRVRTFIV